MSLHRPSTLDQSRSGQILVIVAVGMVAFIAMVGLVIDGGNAWGQQRETQNGADAAAKAGAAVIQGIYTDGDPTNDPSDGASAVRSRRRPARVAWSWMPPNTPTGRA